MTDKPTTSWYKLKKQLETITTASDKTILREEDISFLAVVASDVVAGEASVADRYPHIYNKLLTNHEWRVAFISLLYTLTTDPEDLVYTTRIPDWDYIQTNAKVQPIVRRPSWETWEAVWQKSIPQLRQLFSSNTQSVMRSDAGIVEYYDLLRTEFRTGADTYEVMLTAHWPKDNTEYLFVTVALYQDIEQEVTLEASLNWGRYEDKVTIVVNTTETFAPVPLDLILQTADDDDYVSAPLAFQLTNRQQ